jgi:ABC-type sugar transport system ATPase subunit
MRGRGSRTRPSSAPGVSIVFLSHALEEALQPADRSTVLRDGQHVVTNLKVKSTARG